MWTIWTQNSQYIQHLFSVIGTVATIIFAYIGLSAWQRQMRGQNRFSHATKLLLLANRIRDTILAERANPHPLNWHEGVPEPTPENVRAVENNLSNERTYLDRLLQFCQTSHAELHETAIAVDGQLPINVRAVCDDLTASVKRWEEAITARRKHIDYCSDLRRYESLKGRESLDAILVRDERPDSLAFEENLRRSAIRIAEQMQPFL